MSAVLSLVLVWWTGFVVTGLVITLVTLGDWPLDRVVRAATLWPLWWFFFLRGPRR